MRELWNRILTSPRWFAGFALIIGFIVLFFWHLISPESYVREIDSFTLSIKIMLSNLVAGVMQLVIMSLGVYLLWTKVFFKRKPPAKGH